jgi:thymidine kinase
VGVLRFSFGTMGSGKSTMALQIHHNLRTCGQRGLLLTRLDREGGQVSSRLGVSAAAIDIPPEADLYALVASYHPLDYVVCDEAQFLTPAQVDQLARCVDDLGLDVFAFGLITDFRGELFEGTKRLLEMADEKMAMQVEARCWCGARAIYNARLVNGAIAYEGEVVVVGDTSSGAVGAPLFGDSVTYELLCRRHYRTGATWPPRVT